MDELICAIYSVEECVAIVFGLNFLQQLSNTKILDGSLVSILMNLDFQFFNYLNQV